MNLVITATGDPAITDKIVKLSHNVLNAGVSMIVKLPLCAQCRKHSDS